MKEMDLDKLIRDMLGEVCPCAEFWPYGAAEHRTATIIGIDEEKGILVDKDQKEMPIMYCTKLREVTGEFTQCPYVRHIQSMEECEIRKKIE